MLLVAVACADEAVVTSTGATTTAHEEDHQSCARLASQGECAANPYAMAKHCATFCASLLHSASFKGDAEMVTLLLGGGVVADMLNEQGATALQFACFGGHVAVARLLLDAGGQVDAKDGSGAAAIHRAAFQGYAELVKMLSERGAAMDARDSDGAAAIHLAAYRGHNEVVRALLDGGAATNARDAQNVTALHRATYQGTMRHVEVVRVLLGGGAAVDVKNIQGVTPLHRASSHGHIEVVRALLEGGASVNAVDLEGKGALAYAAYHGHADLVRVLCGGGAVVDAKDDQGKVALHYAADHGSADVIRVLLVLGASVDATDDRLKTALHRAARHGHSRAVVALLDGSARSMRSEDGVTPIESAIYHSQDGSALEVVRALLDGSSEARESIAEPHPWNGQTALHIASYLNDVPMQDVLIAHGAVQDSVSHLQARDGRELRGELAASASYDANASAAQTIDQLSVHIGEDESEWVARATRLWHEQGVVIFPALLNSSVTHQLREIASSALLDDRADLSALIRQRSTSGSAPLRTLRPMSVSNGRHVLASVSSTLSPFLAGALHSPSQLLLDFGAYQTAVGAEAQEMHTDSPFKDGRVAHVQVSLMDTSAGQGAIEVQPATHRQGHASAADDDEDALAIAPVPEGTVLFYRLDVRHRGGRHVLDGLEDRLIASLKLMGERAFVPDGIPLKVLPEDAGRWWLADGAVVDRSAGPLGDSATPPQG